MLKSAVLVIHKGNRWTHSLKMFIFTLETNHHVCLGHLGLLRLGCSFVANRCQPYDFTRINFTHCSGQRQSDNHRSSLKVVVNNQQWLQLWLQSSNMTSQHCLASSRRQTNTKISWDLDILFHQFQHQITIGSNTSHRNNLIYKLHHYCSRVRIMVPSAVSNHIYTMPKLNSLGGNKR